MDMVISLDELDNTNNLENGRLSNVLLRYYVIDSEEFTTYEPAMPQYKKLKNWELNPSCMKEGGVGMTLQRS